jgi:hypothetical protein
MRTDGLAMCVGTKNTVVEIKFMARVSIPKEENFWERIKIKKLSFA